MRQKPARAKKPFKVVKVDPDAIREAIKKANFKVVVDAVNSTGGIAIPALLERLGVACVELYCEPNGHFLSRRRPTISLPMEKMRR